MPLFAVLAAVLVLAAVAGAVITWQDAHSGVGKPAREGSWRWPHGRVVRTSVLEVEDEPSPARLVKHVAVPSLAVSAVLGGATLAGPLAGYNAGATIAALLAAMVIAAVGRGGQKGAGRAFCWAIVGLAVGCTLSVLLGLALPGIPAAAVNLLSALFGALGASAAVMLMPARTTFAREFADGVASVVRLGSASRPGRELAQLEDACWEVPQHLREAAARLDKPQGRKPRADALGEGLADADRPGGEREDGRAGSSRNTRR